MIPLGLLVLVSGGSLTESGVFFFSPLFWVCLGAPPVLLQVWLAVLCSLVEIECWKNNQAHAKRKSTKKRTPGKGRFFQRQGRMFYGSSLSLWFYLVGQIFIISTKTTTARRFLAALSGKLHLFSTPRTQPKRTCVFYCSCFFFSFSVLVSLFPGWISWDN